MAFLWLSARKDLARRLTDRAALLIWIGIPLLIGGLMSLVSGGGGGATPKAQVLLVDQDDTFLSRLLAGGGGTHDLGDFLAIEKVELEEGRARIDAGDASALLILPDGFGRAVLREEPAELTLVTNPAQRILPRMVREALEMLVEAGFYVQRVLGEPLRDLLDQEPEDLEFFPDAVVAGFSGEINRRLRALDGLLFPPVLELEVEIEREDEGGGFDFGLLMLPGVLFMSLLFIAQGMSEDVWQEQRQGTLRRVACTPHGLASFLGGKLLCAALIMVVVGAGGLSFATAVFDLSLALLPVAILWSALGGAALLCLFVVVQTLASSQRAGNVLTTVVLFPLMMIGGSFFPFEIMPAWMAAVGRWTPNGLAVVRLKELCAGDLRLVPLAASAIGMAVPAALAFLVALRLLRARFLGAGGP